MLGFFCLGSEEHLMSLGNQVEKTRGWGDCARFLVPKVKLFWWKLMG